jgi:hypothetical protein
MDSPDVPFVLATSTAPGSAIDLTDQTLDLDDGVFHVCDRVQRLKGGSEPASWGTVTARVVRDGESDDWLVVDNDGATHLDNEADLCRAIRGQARRHGSGTQ